MASTVPRKLLIIELAAAVDQNPMIVNDYPPKPYNTRHNANNSTQQYYDPHRLKRVVQIRIPEEKSRENKANTEVIKAMIPIGKCGGLLFGPIEMVKEAQAYEINISYKTQMDRKTKKQLVLQVFTAGGVYLGQCDKKLQSIFGAFVRDKKMQMKAKIVDADLDVLRKRLPPNRFVKKLCIEVLSTYDCILDMVQCTRKKVKSWKWAHKEIILHYFEGEEVEMNALYSHVMDSNHQSEAHSGGLLQSYLVRICEYVQREELKNTNELKREQNEWQYKRDKHLQRMREKERLLRKRVFDVIHLMISLVDCLGFGRIVIVV
eukprot:305010_1